MVNANVPDEIIQFAQRCEERARSGLDQYQLTAQIRDDLIQVLADGVELPEEFTRPNPDHYVMYPLYVSESGDLSVASAVWNVGQQTPVHGHETWGVVGIYSGLEHERQYEKPTVADIPLVHAGEETWKPGEVTVCCTTDNDVHEVWSEGNQPCVGIHVYGTDIGEIQRRRYDPETGEQSWFVSSWAPVEKGA